MMTLVEEKKPVHVKSSNLYQACFDRWMEAEGGQSPAWLKSLRRTGIEHFVSHGFPTTSHESWRYTNVLPIARMAFRPALRSSGAEVSAADLTPHLYPGARHLVFVDGHYAPQLSSSTFPEGIKVGNIASLLEDASVQTYLSQHAVSSRNPFIALNSAFFQDGVFLEVTEGRVITEPIQILFVSTSQESGATLQPRNLILARKRSVLNLTETYVALKEGCYFTNPVTEVVLEAGSRVEHCKVQNESQEAFHVAAIHVHQEKGSHYTSHSISTGARIARNNIQTVLYGKEAEAVFNGLYLAHDDQLVDHQTVIDHAMPNCNSHEFYHGILGGRSRGVFNGKIMVRKDAQKTNAKQTNKGILLSDDATLDTKPQLEIFADDVKCTHGATVGQLDEDAIFYLRSRGIGQELARRMLIFAFASDILSRISNTEVRESLGAFINRRLESDYSESTSVETGRV